VNNPLFEYFPMSGHRAVINYNGLEFSVNAEIAEDLMEVMHCIDAVFDGRHFFRIPADSGEYVQLWVTAGIPIAMTFPPEYELGHLPRSYVETFVRMSQ